MYANPANRNGKIKENFKNIQTASHIVNVAGPPSAVWSESDCESKGRWFEPQLHQYFRGDLSWNNFYGRSSPSTDSRRADVSFWRKSVLFWSFESPFYV